MDGSDERRVKRRNDAPMSSVSMAKKHRYLEVPSAEQSFQDTRLAAAMLPTIVRPPQSHDPWYEQCSSTAQLREAVVTDISTATRATYTSEIAVFLAIHAFTDDKIVFLNNLVHYGDRTDERFRGLCFQFVIGTDTVNRATNNVPQLQTLTQLARQWSHQPTLRRGTAADAVRPPVQDYVWEVLYAFSRQPCDPTAVLGAVSHVPPQVAMHMVTDSSFPLRVHAGETRRQAALRCLTEEAVMDRADLSQYMLGLKDTWLPAWYASKQEPDPYAFCDVGLVAALRVPTWRVHGNKAAAAFLTEDKASQYHYEAVVASYMEAGDPDSCFAVMIARSLKQELERQAVFTANWTATPGTVAQQRQRFMSQLECVPWALANGMGLVLDCIGQSHGHELMLHCVSLGHLSHDALSVAMDVLLTDTRQEHAYLYDSLTVRRNMDLFGPVLAMLLLVCKWRVCLVVLQHLCVKLTTEGAASRMPALWPALAVIAYECAAPAGAPDPHQKFQFKDTVTLAMPAALRTKAYLTPLQVHPLAFQMLAELSVAEILGLDEAAAGYNYAMMRTPNTDAVFARAAVCVLLDGLLSPKYEAWPTYNSEALRGAGVGHVVQFLRAEGNSPSTTLDVMSLVMEQCDLASVPHAALVQLFQTVQPSAATMDTVTFVAGSVDIPAYVKGLRLDHRLPQHAYPALHEVVRRADAFEDFHFGEDMQCVWEMFLEFLKQAEVADLLVRSWTDAVREDGPACRRLVTDHGVTTHAYMSLLAESESPGREHLQAALDSCWTAARPRVCWDYMRMLNVRCRIPRECVRAPPDPFFATHFLCNALGDRRLFENKLEPLTVNHQKTLHTTPNGSSSVDLHLDISPQAAVHLRSMFNMDGLKPLHDVMHSPQNNVEDVVAHALQTDSRSRHTLLINAIKWSASNLRQVLDVCDEEAFLEVDKIVSERMVSPLFLPAVFAYGLFDFRGATAETLASALEDVRGMIRTYSTYAAPERDSTVWLSSLVEAADMNEASRLYFARYYQPLAGLPAAFSAGKSLVVSGNLPVTGSIAASDLSPTQYQRIFHVTETLLRDDRAFGREFVDCLNHYDAGFPKVLLDQYLGGGSVARFERRSDEKLDESVYHKARRVFERAADVFQSVRAPEEGWLCVYRGSSPQDVKNEDAHGRQLVTKAMSTSTNANIAFSYYSGDKPEVVATKVLMKILVAPGVPLLYLNALNMNEHEVVVHPLPRDSARQLVLHRIHESRLAGYFTHNQIVVPSATDVPADAPVQRVYLLTFNDVPVVPGGVLEVYHTQAPCVELMLPRTLQDSRDIRREQAWLKSMHRTSLGFVEWRLAHAGTPSDRGLTLTFADDESWMEFPDLAYAVNIHNRRLRPYEVVMGSAAPTTLNPFYAGSRSLLDFALFSHKLGDGTCFWDPLFPKHPGMDGYGLFTHRPANYPRRLLPVTTLGNHGYVMVFGKSSVASPFPTVWVAHRPRVVGRHGGYPLSSQRCLPLRVQTVQTLNMTLAAALELLTDGPLGGSLYRSKHHPDRRVFIVSSDPRPLDELEHCARDTGCASPLVTEAHVLSTLNLYRSPYVPQYFGLFHCTGDGMSLLQTSAPTGVPMPTYLAGLARLSPEERERRERAIVFHVLYALYELSPSRFVHGDLRPHNILVYQTMFDADQPQLFAVGDRSFMVRCDYMPLLTNFSKSTVFQGDAPVFVSGTPPSQARQLAEQEVRGLFQAPAAVFTRELLLPWVNGLISMLVQSQLPITAQEILRNWEGTAD